MNQQNTKNIFNKSIFVCIVTHDQNILSKIFTRIWCSRQSRKTQVISYTTHYTIKNMTLNVKVYQNILNLFNSIQLYFLFILFQIYSSYFIH